MDLLALSIILAILVASSVPESKGRKSSFELVDGSQNVIKLGAQTNISFKYDTTGQDNITLRLTGIPNHNKFKLYDVKSSPFHLQLNCKDLFTEDMEHGVYSVDAVLCGRDNRSIPLIIIYEEPIENVSLIVDDNLTHVNESITAVASFSRGTNVIFEWWTTGGQSMCYEEVTSPSNTTSLITFDFTTAGNYTLFFVASNGLSSKTLRKDVMVLESPRASSEMKIAVQNHFNVSFENTSFKCTPGKDLTKSVLEQGGSSFNYSVKINDFEKYKNESNLKHYVFRYKIRKAGKFNVELHGFNGLQSSINNYQIVCDYDISKELMILDQMIVIPPGLLRLKLALNNDYTEDNETRIISCSLDNSSWTEYHLIKRRTVELNTYIDSSVTNNYTYHISCKNLRTKFNYSGTLMLKVKKCFASERFANGFDQRTEHQLIAYVESDIRLTTRLAVNCSCSKRPLYTWTVVNKTDSSTIETFVNHPSETIALCKLCKICGTTGQYSVSVNVSLRECGAGKSDIWAYEAFLLKIMSPTPMAFIEGGNYRKIENTVDIHNETLCAYPRYLDGLVNDNNLGYDWNCFRNGDSMNCNESNPGYAILDTSSVQTGDNITVSVQIRWGQINSNYTQQIEFKKYTSVSNASMRRRPFQCIKNCLDKVSMDKKVMIVVCKGCTHPQAILYSKIIPGETSRGIANSPVSSTAQMTTENSVSVFPKAGTISECNIERTKSYTTNANAKLQFQRTSISNFTSVVEFETKDLIERGQSNEHRLLLCDEDSHLSTFEIMVNLKPYNGSCHLTKTEGFELQDEFVVVCSDWLDEGQRSNRDIKKDKADPSPLYYRILLTDWDAGASIGPVILYEGWNSVSDVLHLPRGRKDIDYLVHIRVDVMDLYGDSAEVFLNATVHPSNNFSSLIGFIDDILNSPMDGLKKAQISASSLVSASKEVEQDNTLSITVWLTNVTLEDLSKTVEMNRKINKINDQLSEMLLMEVTTRNLTSLKDGDFPWILTILNMSSSLKETANPGIVDNLLKCMDNLVTKTDGIIRKMQRSREKDEMINTIATGVLSVLDKLVSHSTAETIRTLDSQMEELDTMSQSTENEDQQNKTKIKMIENLVLEKRNTQQHIISTSTPMMIRVLDRNTNLLDDDLTDYEPTKNISLSYIAQYAEWISSQSLKYLKREVLGTKVSFKGCSLSAKNSAASFHMAKINVGSLVTGGTTHTLIGGILMVNLDAESTCELHSDMPVSHHVHSTTHLMDQMTENFTYFKFHVAREDDAVIMYLHFDKEPRINMIYVAYIGGEFLPTREKYDYKMVLGQKNMTSNGYKLFVPEGIVRPKYAYLGIIQEKEHDNSKRRKRDTDAYLTYKLRNLNRNSVKWTTMYKTTKAVQDGTSTAVTASTNIVKQTFSLKLMVLSSGCRTLEEKTYSWSKRNCQVLDRSTLNFTVCKCKHSGKSILATTFFVAPNALSFTAVFQHFDASNAAIYGTLIVLFCLYIVAVILLRRQDEKDNSRWATYFLCDSDSHDSYFYLITVYTGMRRGAGTKSNVTFILSGDSEDSGVRLLNDGSRKGFETGSVRRFFMGTRLPLGDLSFLRIWHDDSGTGVHQSWYLTKAVVDDLQAKQSYTFLCESWLSSHCGDGKVDRVIPAASIDKDATFALRFTDHVRENISENHIWLSLLVRPQRSNFTRVQRASCGLCLLLLTMVVNAMFYGRERGGITASQVQMGSLNFSLTDVYVSAVGIVITTPIILLLSCLFRKTRSKPRTVSKHNQLLSEMVRTRTKSHADATIPCDDFYRAERLPLPHWIRYLTWTVLILVTVFCTFVMISYSMEWGKAKSSQWLLSFVLSFVQSIFVVDPLKVIVLAVLFAVLFKTRGWSFETQVDLDSIKAVSSTFDNLQETRFLTSLRMEVLAKDGPPDVEVLQQSRQRRKQEAQAQRVLVELIMYTVVAFVIYAISYIGRDQRSFNLKNNIENVMLKTSKPSFYTVKSSQEFIEWLDKAFVPNFYPYDDCHGNKREYVFISDCNNIRIGPARLRQVRMRPETCASDIIRTHGLCVQKYDRHIEETSPFCPGWKKYGTNNCSDSTNSKNAFSDFSIWSYKSDNDLENIATVGEYNTYSGGGYVLILPPTRLRAEKLMKDLPSSGWINRGTRAVFLDFALYNPNLNLFTYSSILTEFPETGSTLSWANIHVLRPYDMVGSTGVFALCCYVIFCLLLFLGTLDTLRNIKRLRWQYFKRAWNVLDLLCVLLCYTLIIFYLMRTLAANVIISQFMNHLISNEFTNFQRLVILDFAMQGIISVMVFVVTIRILKILGYNKRLTEITAVITNAFWDLLGFGLVFTIIFMAYVLYGYLLFGSSLSQYMTVFSSFGTLINTLIGKNRLEVTVSSVPGIAQLYYFTYNFSVLWTVMTMFAAILNKSIDEVRTRMKKQPRVFGVFDMLVNSFRSLFGGVSNTGTKKKATFETPGQTPISFGRFSTMNVVKLIRDILEKHANVYTTKEGCPTKSKPDDRATMKGRQSSFERPAAEVPQRKFWPGSNYISYMRASEESRLSVRRRKSVSRAGTLQDIDLSIEDEK